MSALSADTGRVRVAPQHRPRYGEPIFRGVVIVASLVVLGIVAGLVVVIANESVLGAAHNGVAFLRATPGPGP